MRATTRIEIPLRFKVVIDDKDVVEFLENHKRLAPIRFGYTTEHAEYQEYGTGPHRNRGKHRMGERAKREITEWARLKVGKEGKELSDFVRAVMWRIYNTGIRPRPFLRPAMADVQNRMQELWDRGYSLYDMGDEIQRISDRYIMDYNMPYKGILQSSWFNHRIDQMGKSVSAEEDAPSHRDMTSFMDFTTNFDRRKSQ